MKPWSCSRTSHNHGSRANLIERELNHNGSGYVSADLGLIYADVARYEVKKKPKKKKKKGKTKDTPQGPVMRNISWSTTLPITPRASRRHQDQRIPIRISRV